MTTRLCPKGGLITDVRDPKDPEGGTFPVRIGWNEEGVVLGPLGPDGPKRIIGLVTLVLEAVGSGLAVQFDQSLLRAEPGCVPAGEGPATAVLQASADLRRVRIINVPPNETLNAQIDEIKAAVQADPGAFDATKSVAVERPTVGGIPVTEKKPDEKPPKKTSTRKKPQEQVAAGLKENSALDGPLTDSENRALETVRLGSEVPQKPPALPNPTATQEFRAEIAGIEQRQLAERDPSTPDFRKPEPVVEPTPDPKSEFLEWAVRLLTQPPMPRDLHPVDTKRHPSDKRLADTALVRLYFQRPVEQEFQKNAADPNFWPADPAGDPVIDTATDQGVAACVQLLHETLEYARETKREIPQLETFFLLGNVQEVTQLAVQRVAARRPRNQ